VEKLRTNTDMMDVMSDLIESYKLFGGDEDLYLDQLQDGQEIPDSGYLELEGLLADYAAEGPEAPAYRTAPGTDIKPPSGAGYMQIASPQTSKGIEYRI